MVVDSGSEGHIDTDIDRLLDEVDELLSSSDNDDVASNNDALDDAASR